MWCAEWCVSFRSLQRQLRLLLKSDEAFAKIIEKQHPETWRELIEGTPSIRLSYEEARALVLHECIVEFFSNSYSLSVFSPGGVRLKIDSRIAAHRFIPKIGWQFSFIDRETGIISGKHFEKIHALASEQLAAMRVDLDDVDKSASRYAEYYTLCGVEDDWEAWQSLKPFDGWAVGCDMDEADFGPEDFLCLEGEPDDLTLLEWESAGLAKLERAPNLKDEIIKALDDGRYRSKAQLKADVFPDETRDAFRAAYAEAAKERPELSKRGPKPLIY